MKTVTSIRREDKDDFDRIVARFGFCAGAVADFTKINSELCLVQNFVKLKVREMRNCILRRDIAMVIIVILSFAAGVVLSGYGNSISSLCVTSAAEPSENVSDVSCLEIVQVTINDTNGFEEEMLVPASVTIINHCNRSVTAQINHDVRVLNPGINSVNVTVWGDQKVEIIGGQTILVRKPSYYPAFTNRINPCGQWQSSWIIRPQTGISYQ